MSEKRGSCTAVKLDTKRHTKCDRCTVICQMTEPGGFICQRRGTKKYYDVRKYGCFSHFLDPEPFFFFCTWHILLDVSPANCHLLAALHIAKVRFLDILKISKKKVLTEEILQQLTYMKPCDLHCSTGLSSIQM